MNTELIKEIRKKAIIEWTANNRITVHEFMDEPENIEALEKFAELIVQECLEVCNRQANHYVETNNRAATSVADVLGRIIQMHFGIE